MCKVVTVVESQSMMHTKKMREKGHNVNYDDILTTGQVAGCLMGAFSNLSQPMYFVQPITWKGTLPKDKAHNFVAHRRYYHHLGLTAMDDLVTCIHPDPAQTMGLCAFSEDKINPGDFADINDSLGLALYGVKKYL